MSARLFFLAALAVLPFGLSALADDPPLSPDLDRKLKEAGQQFAKGKQRATDEAVAAFKKLAGQYRTASGLTPAARVDKVKATDDARKGFEATGQFPMDDEYADLALTYYQKLNKAYLPLNRMLNREIQTGLEKKNDEYAVAARKLLESVEKQVPGTDRLTAGSVWAGTLRRGGEIIRYQLRVNKQAGNTFVGHVEDNPGVGGNWSYDLQGQTSGLEVEWVMTKLTRGKFNAVRVAGVVSGDRMIGIVTSQSGKGKPGTGLMVLTRR